MMLVLDLNTLTGKELAVMPEAQQDWITKRIDAARKVLPISDAIALTITAQLQGTMRERALRPAELTALAQILFDEANNPSGDVALK